jgi:glycosyltransferase involved in cell wall biosynthesis
MKYSVIIPTYNRSDLLERSLTHLSKIEPPRNEWEVLVVDNGSKDNTKDVVHAFAAKIANLRYLFEPRPGMMMGRHLGCEQAEGEILCYLDDDSFVDRKWLCGIEQAFSDPDVVLAGGPDLPKYESDPPEWLEYFWRPREGGRMLGELSLIDLGGPPRSVSTRYVFGCNFNIRKDIFLKIGGSHPDCLPKKLQKYQGDGETAVSRKLTDLGYSAFYSPDIKIHHFVPSSRMTIEYFRERHFYEGVCVSFRQIRQEAGIEKARESAGPDRKNGKLREYVKSLASLRGRSAVENPQLTEVENQYQKVKAATGEGFKAGKEFHRAAVENDPALLEYVLRENFLGKNGEIPAAEGGPDEFRKNR